MLKTTRRFLKPVTSPLKWFARSYSYPITFHHFLRNLPSIQISKLANGLTVVTQEREAYNATVGIFVDAGSRYESAFENGITHFFEHIAFKGTLARTRPVLEQQMACTGARFDCSCTREMTSFRAHTLSQHVPLCVDILTDCIYNNSYCETEIEQQRKVVYLEMQDHDCDHNCILDDYLHATAFQGTPLAHTVMGPSCNMFNFNGHTMSRYMKKYFDANRTVLAAVGGVRHEQMMALAETYMSKLEPTTCIDLDVYRFTGSEIRARDDSQHLATVALAVEGPCMCDSDRVVMEVAAEIIGGWERAQGGGNDHSYPIARASSLAKFSDAYRSFYITYKDTGLWGIKFQSPSLNLDDMLAMVQEEIMNLCVTLTEGEVERARRVLKTKMLSEDAELGRSCADTGRSVLYSGARESLAARIAAVEGVHAAVVREACDRYLYDRCPAVAVVGPTEGLPDYTRIRAGMYWLRT